MVFGIKGPKSILSTAIANALAQFFVVDAKQIESNLLKDTKIVLNNVLLRKQVARLPVNSAGEPTLITITGSVKQVAFTWTWAVGSNKDENNLDAWVRDSKLTLKGLEFKAKLEYGTGQEELTVPPASPEKTVSDSVDSNQAAQIKNQGGIQAWILSQVQMIVDSLDLDVEDFQFTVEIPPPLAKPDTSNVIREQTSIVMSGSKVLNISHGRQPVGSTKALSSSSETPPTVIQQQLSFGSLSINVIEAMPSGSDDDDSVNKTVYPILEPFTYSADMTRSSGQRFDGFATGLTLIGKPVTTEDEETPTGDAASSGLVVHFGTAQAEALTQLGIMLLPPPESANDGFETGAPKGNESQITADTTVDRYELLESNSIDATQNGKSQNESDTEPENAETSTTTQDGAAPPDHAENTADKGQEAAEEKDMGHTYTTPVQDEVTVSVFVFPMKSVSLVLDGNAKVTFPLLVVSYEADGSVMDITASGCRMESISPDGGEEKGPTVAVSGVKLELRPKMELTLNEVTEIYVPGVIRLTKPIENPRFTYEGKTLSVDIDTIEAEVPTKRDVKPPKEQVSALPTSRSNSSAAGSVSEASSNADAPAEESTPKEDSKSQDDTKGDSASRPIIPFPLIISVNDIKVSKVAQLHNLDLYVNPNLESISTDVAMVLDEFNSELLYFDKVNFFAALPLDKPNEIQSLTFAAKSGRVSAGYSTKDWASSFQPEPQADTKKDKSTTKQSRSADKSSVLKFPYASVSPLNLKISWQGKAVSVKDTEVSVKPFKGDANTTSEDLMNYYVGAILCRVPGFISNADVLGINVVNHAASTYGTWLGKGLFGGAWMGVGGGVAALAAVDGVKGAVRAGKTSRNAENGSSWQPGDLFRGVVYSVGAATKTGAIKRGKDGKGNIADSVADFLVGVTIDTEGYVSENKSKLGAATMGGVGTVAGALVAGKFVGMSEYVVLSTAGV